MTHLCPSAFLVKMADCGSAGLGAQTSKAAFRLNGNTGPKIGRRSIDKYAYFGMLKQCGLSKP